MHQLATRCTLLSWLGTIHCHSPSPRVVSCVSVHPSVQQTITPTPTAYRLRGRVVNGFGRGSKLLGCPTANLDPASFASTLVGVPRGVYAGWAQVRGGEVFKTVLSLGTNPQFATESETVESYILHEFAADFYGEELALIIVGFMRPMEKYTGLDELIQAISRDVRVGDTSLDKSPYAEFKDDEFFKHDATNKPPAAAIAVAETK
jgi:hypothetical protein